MAAIEKLIGQSIPRAEARHEAAVADGTVGSLPSESRQPRETHAREGGDAAREGSRAGRKPRREREPRRAGTGRQAPTPPQAADGGTRGATAPPPPPRAPSIGRPEAPRLPREPETEPADHSHLPAFLLRPVRARV